MENHQGDTTESTEHKRHEDLELNFLGRAIPDSGPLANSRNMTEAVLARLVKGAEEYGDGAFWTADCLEEMLEECLDILGWGSLEYTKLAEGGQTEAADELAEIARTASTLHTRLRSWRKRAYGSPAALAS